MDGVQVPRTVLHDRRRPGRDTDVSPELIPLLRGTVNIDAARILEALEKENPLLPARGIIVAVSLSLVFWLALSFTLWLWL